MNDLHHLLADGTDLRGGGVSCLLDLIGPSLGEGNSEQPEEVVVGGLDRDVGLNKGLPFAHERPKLVGGEIQPVKVGQTVLPLHLIHPQLHLPECMVFVLLQVGQ